VRAFAFDEPRAVVIIITIGPPTINWASAAGTCSGGRAPTAFASSGIQSDAAAGSSSTMLNSPVASLEAELVSMACLVVLETRSPVERAVF
jgi:hypothetical protein